MPSIYFAMASSFLLYAWFRLGHFPSYNNPDPSRIGLGLGTFGLSLLLSHVICWTAYLIVCSRGLVVWEKFRTRVMVGSLCVLMWSAFYLSVRYDPLGFIDWLAD